MSPRPKLITPQGNLPEAIKETAWRQIAQDGAPALSLRAIARELNITAPAIYNYYSDRDALVTALIVDAFTAFGDDLEGSIIGIPENEHALRLHVLGQAYRQWAVTYPERYQLIFGTPIAGYVAPVEITMPAAARSLSVLVSVLQSAYANGKLRPGFVDEIQPQATILFASLNQENHSSDDVVLFLALVIWGQVHGLVSMEIGRQLPPFISDPGQVYNLTLKLVIAQYLSDPN